MDNKILFDWFSFTVKTKRIDSNGVLLQEINERDLISLLGLEDVEFEQLPGIMGIYGFENRLYSNSITIHYNSRIVDYIWVEMSGQGCRAFESLSSHADYNYIFNFCLSNSDIVNITRLDVAYDDFQGLLDIYAIADDTVPDYRDTKQYNFVSPLRAHDLHLSDKGICVTIGSCRSDIMFRIYDKAAERNKSDDIPHWVRCEMQLRRERAHEFIRLLIEENETVDNLYFLVLNHYLRFVEPDPSDSNKSRWHLAAHWVAFAYSVTTQEKSLFVKPGMEYNLEKLDKVVENQFAGAVYTYLQCHGIDRLVNTLDEKFKKTKLNKKYKRLLDEQAALEEIVTLNDEIFPDLSYIAWLLDEDIYEK